MFDATGDVVGIAAGAPSDAQGITFVIPISHAAGVLALVWETSTSEGLKERIQNFEEIASVISRYTFASGNIVEFIQRGWTTTTALVPLLNEYNGLIRTLKGNEEVFRGRVGRYWGKSEMVLFQEFMKSVDVFDEALHGLNDEFEDVNITNKKVRIEPQRAAKAVLQLGPGLQSLKLTGRRVLSALQ